MLPFKNVLYHKECKSVFKNIKMKNKTRINRFLLSIFVVMITFSCSTEKEIPSITNSQTKSFRYGEIVWYDLITPDIEKSKEFYAAIFDWKLETFKVKGQKYVVIYKENVPIGGMIEIKSAESAVWIAAKSVKNVAAFNQNILENGGEIIIEKTVIPGRGDFSIIQGNQGEKISLINSLKGDPANHTVIRNETWLWLELWSDNPTKSIAFYKDAFKLDTEESVLNNLPYWNFTYNDVAVAGMIKNPLTNRSTQWVPYIQIEDFETIIYNIESNNGYFILRPKGTLDSGNIAVFQDPLGATVCLQNWNN